MRCEARISTEEGKTALCGKPAKFSVEFSLPLYIGSTNESIPACGKDHARQIRSVVETDLESYGFPPEVSVELLDEI